MSGTHAEGCSNPEASRSPLDAPPSCGPGPRCAAKPLLSVLPGAGIGLLSVRGSGTSGYVQGNKFNLRGPPQRDLRERDDSSGPVHKKPNQQILEHNRKRELELEVETMRAQLEDDE